MDILFHQILEEIYSKYDHDPAHDISGILAAHRGKEKELIRTLLIKYSANPADLNFFRNYFITNSKDFLSALYGKYNPVKLGEIDNLVAKFQEKGSIFLTQLCARYHLEPGSLIDFIDLQKFKSEDYKGTTLNQTEETGKKVPPKRQEKHYNYPGKKKFTNVFRFVAAIVILLVLVLSIVYYYHKKRIEQAKRLQEKSIADSVRVADSLAMIHAEQQRIADSLAMVQAEQQRIVDSLANSQPIANAIPGEQNIVKAKNAEHPGLDTWMVIIGSFKTEEQANTFKHKVYNDYKLGTEILSTSDYVNFAKDLFIVVTKKNVSKTLANYSLNEIKQLGIECYIKDSGGPAK